MRVYSCSGWAFDDAGPEGVRYFRTKAEAMLAAREATRPDASIAGSEATVTMDIIAKPIGPDRIVAMLNHANWVEREEIIATVRNGRIVK
jgi:hypothetical protein